MEQRGGWLPADPMLATPFCSCQCKSVATRIPSWKYPSTIIFSSGNKLLRLRWEKAMQTGTVLSLLGQKDDFSVLPAPVSIVSSGRDNSNDPGHWFQLPRLSCSFSGWLFLPHFSLIRKRNPWQLQIVGVDMSWYGSTPPPWCFAHSSLSEQMACLLPVMSTCSQNLP